MMAESSDERTTGSVGDSIIGILRMLKIEFDRRWEDGPSSKSRLCNFELIKTLGRGKYGRVVLAKYLCLPLSEDKNSHAVKKLSTLKKSPTVKTLSTLKKSHAAVKSPTIKKLSDDHEKTRMGRMFFAIKIMPKSLIVKYHGTKHVFRERKILRTVRHPFLVKYENHFKDLANLYLVMEYVAGGDLFSHLRRIRHFNESTVNFYASQLVLSLEYLHFMGIIYRDLKPENLMLDVDGFIKITDFGFSKKIDDGKTSTMCGTPEYLAPELIKGEDYSYSVDWWTFGIILFEFLNGFTPFRSSNLLETLHKIVKGHLVYPPSMKFVNDECKDLISTLLNVNPNERLTDPSLIRSHRYFIAVDWVALYHKKVQVPFKPTIQSPTDTENFEDQGPVQVENIHEDPYEEIFRDF